MPTMVGFWLIVLSSLAVAASGSTSTICRSYQCGRAVDIRYPFWVGGGNDTAGAGNASHCGYPSLRLECRHGTPVMRLPSGEYGVTSIHYGDNSAGDRTVTLFDLRVSLNGSCPFVAGRNLTLPPGSPPPLSLTASNGKLIFLLDCPFAGISASNVVPCLQHGQNRSYVFRDGPVPQDAAKLCHEIVSMPVLNRLDGIVPALKAGFQVSWRPADGGRCGVCEKAGGFCGQRREVAQDTWMFSCFPASKSSGARKISPRLLIGVVGIGSILLIGCIALCLICWGKKRAAVEQEEEVDSTNVNSPELSSPELQ